MGYRSYSYDEYLKAMDMRRRGLGPMEISRKLGIKKYIIDAWIYRNIKPPAVRWLPEPSKELACIFGVLHGDGSLYTNGYHYYKMQLEVKDYEFAEVFSIAMAKNTEQEIFNANMG